MNKFLLSIIVICSVVLISCGARTKIISQGSPISGSEYKKVLLLFNVDVQPGSFYAFIQDNIIQEMGKESIEVKAFYKKELELDNSRMINFVKEFQPDAYLTIAMEGMSTYDRTVTNINIYSEFIDIAHQKVVWKGQIDTKPETVLGLTYYERTGYIFAIDLLQSLGKDSILPVAFKSLVAQPIKQSEDDSDI